MGTGGPIKPQGCPCLSLDVAALFHAIHTLFEFEDVSFRDLETGWRLHVKVLLEVGIEVSSLDVHLVKFEVMLSCKGEYCVEAMPSTCIKPWAMIQALYFWIDLSGPCLTWKTHLLPMTLQPFGCRTMS